MVVKYKCRWLITFTLIEFFVAVVIKAKEHEESMTLPIQTAASYYLCNGKTMMKIFKNDWQCLTLTLHSLEYYKWCNGSAMSSDGSCRLKKSRTWPENVWDQAKIEPEEQKAERPVRSSFVPTRTENSSNRKLKNSNRNVIPNVWHRHVYSHVTQMI